MKKQKTFFIFGLIFLILGLFSITFLPIILWHHKIYFDDYIYSRVEFVLLSICAGFYYFSPKFYFSQMATILVGFLYFIIFSKFFTFFIN